MTLKKSCNSLLFFLLFFVTSLSAEEFATADSSIVVRFEALNLSDDINDVQAKVCVVKGGEVFCKWSNKDAALTDTLVKGFTEGLPFSVWIYNERGDSLYVKKEVGASSVSESLNSTMIPWVDNLASVLFWDPFAFFGLYDPVIYDENGVAKTTANGTPLKTNIPFIVIWLVAGAAFFTIYFKFINFRGIGETFRLLTGKYGNSLEKDAIGEMTHFQALTTSLSATIGLGNIAGVAIAISLGGPGATFWMVIAGLLGMSSKFVECILGVKYRIIGEDGAASGGPMYYMSRGIKGNLGKILAVVFAVLCVGGSFGGGNMFQANQAFVQASNMIPQLEEYRALFGLCLAILVGLVIVGGVKSIAKVTDKIVPTMAVGYVLAAMIIIIMNIEKTGLAFQQILDGAFSPDALKGGFIGVLVMGFKRAAFSNEAGVGSASIAHAAVKTNYAASEGFVAMIGPFVDTVIVCLMTSLVLIFTGFADGSSALTGAELTSTAFESVFSWYGLSLIHI